MAGILFKWLLSVMLFAAPAKEHHPIFVSVTEIEHNSAEKTLEISCKVFTDDFEKALRLSGKGYIDLLNPKYKAAMSPLVSGYIQKHLQLKVDNKNVALQFLGYEQQDEGIISYYQVNNISSFSKLDITDNILFEYKKEQISLLHVIVKGERKSTKLVNPDDKASFTY